MIGLHISNSKIYQETNHSFIEKKCDDLHVTLSFHELNYRQVYFENENIQIFIDGWIFNSPSYGEQASFVAEQYSHFNSEFISQIEGQFNLFVFDKKEQKKIFANDIFAFRKHFMIGESFIISTDLKFLYDHLEKLSFNHSHIRKNLNQNRYVDIHETFLNETLMIKPSSVTDFHIWEKYSTGIFEKKYMFKEGTVDAVFFVKEAKRNIRNIHKNHPVLLQLSGGMDSRLLIEIFSDLGMEFKTLTYGILDSDELNLAREVAVANNVECKEIEYKPENFIINAKSYSFYTGGLDIFVQSAFQKTIDKLKNGSVKNAVFDTGFVLDIFIGGKQVDLRIDRGSNSFTNEMFDFTRNDVYASELRIFSQLALRQSFHRELLESRYSMFSYENYYLMRSIPLNLLRNYKFYYQIAEFAIIKSREVPLQRTMTPFYKIPSDSTMQELQQRERNSLLAFLEKRELIPHKRYYSDFDMWLRSNKQWKELLNETLLEGKPLISQYIPLIKIEEIISKHNDGTEPNMRLIIRLLSTELFMKETAKYKLVQNG